MPMSRRPQPTGQQIGGSIGISLLNTIFASAVAHYLTSHLSPATVVHGHPGAVPDRDVADPRLHHRILDRGGHLSAPAR
jgi:hypothetical protein